MKILIKATNQKLNFYWLFAHLITFFFLLNSCDLINTETTLNNNVPTDADNKTYKTVTIGEQVWMAENLSTKKYNDGTSIPLITQNEDWKEFGIGDGYCWYSNNETLYKAEYGALYNWQAVISEKICPSGWHVPSRKEWLDLDNYINQNGHYNETGIVLKSNKSWTNQWGKEEGNGTNDYGFNAFPTGFRTEAGAFSNLGMSATWWSSNEFSKGFSHAFSLSYSNNKLFTGSSHQSSGRSIRCIKD